MVLNAGSRLGPYGIVAPLGAGGMGEVYRARDTRLDRTVAIKILPAHVAQAVEARQRFEREARAVSALNHPHICTLYDIGSENGVDYMVMECVEGETLADRIKKGPLPLDQALTFAIQISDALDKAHRRGVVHRDLKPGNIMLGPTGAKILDFGLAKIGQKQGAAMTSAGSLVETLTTPITGEGSIVGTLQYMAPEQLEGKEADSRTDIFAFGSVFYEMLTGRRAFDARSHAALISAIMGTQPPPVSSLQPVAPAALDSLVRGCLEKEPEERWQSAHDVTAQLKWIAASGSQAGVAAPMAVPRKIRNRVLIAAVALLAALSIALGVWVKILNRPAAEAAPVRFTIDPPEGESIAPGPSAPQIAISPNGRDLAFVTSGSVLSGSLWVRAFGSLSAQRLDKTEGAQFPFWSPDSQWIGFFADGKLRRIAAAGGSLQTLYEAGAGEGGAWNREGVIVFAKRLVGGGGGQLYRVPATGGVATPTTTLDRTRGEYFHSWPQFLPDGRRFLYFALSSDREKSGVYVQSLDSNDRTFLLNTTSRAALAPPNLLLFVRGGVLMAQELDLRRLALYGVPRAVAENVNSTEINGRAAFSVSESGTLAYRAGSGVSRQRLVWRNRVGKEIGTVLEPGHYRHVVLSPDEKRVAITYSTDGIRYDLWALELSSSIFSRLTFGPENALYPRWSNDSKQLIFATDRAGKFEFRELALGGGGARQIYTDDRANHLDEWTRDGRFLVYHVHADADTGFIGLLPLEGERKPAIFLQTPFTKSESLTSPDGRWIAFLSTESGRPEIYVASFPSFMGKRQISSGGGREPEWRGDGKELYYIGQNGELITVNVKSGSTLETDPPKALFRTSLQGSLVSMYSVTADGQRFLLMEPIRNTGPDPINVVLNWPSALKR